MVLSEKLNACLKVESLKDLSEKLICRIGIFGGRRFYCLDGTGDLSSVSLNEIVKRLEILFNNFIKTNDIDDVNKVKIMRSIVKKIEQLDSEGEKLLKKSSLFQKIMTILKSLFRKSGYPRLSVLIKIDSDLFCYESKASQIVQQASKPQKIKMDYKNPVNDNYFNDIVTAIGGTHVYLNLPILDLKGNIGKTQYIDFIKSSDMVAHLMRFQDDLGRRGFAARARKINDKEDFVQAFFERRTSVPTWVSAGDRLISFFPYYGNVDDTRNTVKGAGNGCFIDDGLIDQIKYDQVIDLLQRLVHQPQNTTLII